VCVSPTIDLIDFVCQVLTSQEMQKQSGVHHEYPCGCGENPLLSARGSALAASGRARGSVHGAAEAAGEESGDLLGNGRHVDRSALEKVLHGDSQMDTDHRIDEEIELDRSKWEARDVRDHERQHVPEPREEVVGVKLVALGALGQKCRGDERSDADHALQQELVGTQQDVNSVHVRAKRQFVRLLAQPRDRQVERLVYCQLEQFILRVEVAVQVGLGDAGALRDVTRAGAIHAELDEGLAGHTDDLGTSFFRRESFLHRAMRGGLLHMNHGEKVSTCYLRRILRLAGIGHLWRAGCIVVAIHNHRRRDRGTVNSPAPRPLETGTPKLLAELHANGVALVTLNNPERRNALSREMMALLPPLLERLVDLESRVIVICGAGGRAFAAGADLTEVGRAPDSPGMDDIETVYQAMLRAVRDLAVPTISMIRGACLGGGLELALMTDLRYASEDSSFGVPAVRLGLAYARVDPLLALLGPSRTAEILFTGDRIPAEEALTAGLVNRLFATDALEVGVLQRAGEIAGNAPLAVRAVKLALREGAKSADDREDELVRKAVQVCLDSADFEEGRRAFLDKRPPVFTGT
jgi:enoyl-CoA hydratase